MGSAEASRGRLDVGDIATLGRPTRGDISRAMPPVALIVVGAALTFAAIFVVSGPATYLLGGAGAGLFGLAGLSLLDRGRHALGMSRARAAARLILQGDPRASILTDGRGRILEANHAARDASWLLDVPTITGAFARRLAEPEARLAHLADAAALGRPASLTHATADGCLQLNCRRLGRGGPLLWQIERQAQPDLPGLWVDLDDGRIAATSPDASARFAFEGSSGDTLSQVPFQGRRASLPRRGGGHDEVFLIRQGDPAGRARIHILSSDSDCATTPAPAEAMAFDTLPVPILTLSVDGHIELANRQARELLGVGTDDALPAAAQLFEGMGRPIGEWLADAGRGRGLGKPEFVRASTPRGEVFLQVVLGRALSGDGLVAVLNDATELKTLEAQFVQSQKMQAIGQLAGGVAHDFNNLLTAISGHCDLLLLSRSTKDADYSDLVQISQNANRAAALVGQLLAFSRKQAQRPELIDLSETLGDLTHLLNRLVGETIRLEVNHATRRKFIRADPRQLEQVFMNLVVNARDAMENGGRVRIDTRVENIVEPLMRDRAEVAPGEYVVVTLEDEGRGIAPDKLPKIFEPFFTTKRTGEGTGLGLSTVYGIVKQSGGFIFADSAPGRGATFTLYFPAHDAVETPQAQAVAAAPGHVPRGQGVVLLVEDEAPVRSFAARALRMRGWTVLEADSAEAALETLSDDTLKVDVFVTDVIMPGRDGPSWVREALDTRADTRVVFVSGYAEENFPEVQASVPNSMFLPKPFTLEQLSRAVTGELIAAE